MEENQERPIRLAICTDTANMQQLVEIFGPHAAFSVLARELKGPLILKALDELWGFVDVLILTVDIALSYRSSIISKLLQQYHGLKIICLWQADNNLDQLLKLWDHGCHHFLPLGRLARLKEGLPGRSAADLQDLSRSSGSGFYSMDSLLGTASIHPEWAYLLRQLRRERPLTSTCELNEITRQEEFFAILFQLGLSAPVLRQGIMKRGGRGLKFITLREEHRNVPVELATIVAIRTAGNYVRVNNTLYLATMDELEAQLEGTRLARINRFTIIHCDRVAYFKGDVISMGDDIEETLSVEYRDHFLYVMGLREMP